VARTEGHVVAPASRAVIRARALAVRELLGIKTARFPILEVLEWVLPEIHDEFVFEVLDPTDMTRRFGPGTHGMTYPDLAHIIVREDVYEHACKGKPHFLTWQARFSLAHEFGHLVMHAGGGLPRRVSWSTPLYANSEWQADTFAGELLAASTQVEPDDTPDSMASRFGVSFTAARTQYEVFKKEGIL